MSKNTDYFEYKGYHTRIDFDYDSFSLCGKIEGINDLVVFESSDAGKIEQEFHNAVDNYLALCEELGKSPEKEYKGVFNVRIAPELHRKLAAIAYRKSETLNAVVEDALVNYVDSASALIETFSYSSDVYPDYSVNDVSGDSVYSSNFGEVC